MKNRKIDVSTGAGGRTSVLRTRFDAHLNQCPACADAPLCGVAQSMWRDVVLSALKAGV